MLARLSSLDVSELPRDVRRGLFCTGNCQKGKILQGCVGEEMQLLKIVCNGGCVVVVVDV
jgi:hypothetical protein